MINNIQVNHAGPNACLSQSDRLSFARQSVATQYVRGIFSVDVYDLSNPIAPSLAGSYFPGIWAGDDLFVRGSTGFEIIDVTNPLSPTYTGRYTITNTNVFDYRVSAVDGNLYVSTSDAQGNPIKIILDVSNPTAPVEIGTYLHTNGLPLPVGDDLYIYVPAAEKGLLIYWERRFFS